MQTAQVKPEDAWHVGDDLVGVTPDTAVWYGALILTGVGL